MSLIGKRVKWAVINRGEYVYKIGVVLDKYLGCKRSEIYKKPINVDYYLIQCERIREVFND